MAEFELGISREMFLGGLDTFSIVILIITALLLIGFIVWFILFKAQFKHYITLRENTSGRTDKTFFDKYRYTKRKGESQKIQLWSDKSYHPTPPEVAKDILGKNGKEYIEAYRTDGGELKYICCEIANEMINFSSISTEDKEFYANIFMDAQKYKSKGFLEWISENSGLIAILIMSILMIAFWNDIAKTTSGVAASNAQISASNAKMINSLEALLKDRQYIGYLNSTGKLGQDYPTNNIIIPD